MTYLIKQKIRGHTYVYEAENFWDPEKKQSRQKRKYLGVWDEASGMIIPKNHWVLLIFLILWAMNR